MLRWLLIVPFLLLPLACDDDDKAMPAQNSAASSGACAIANAGCAVDGDCCSGLTCNTARKTCQNNATCKAPGAQCGATEDCCGAGVCHEGFCKLPGNSTSTAP